MFNTMCRSPQGPAVGALSSIEDGVLLRVGPIPVDSHSKIHDSCPLTDATPDAACLCHFREILPDLGWDFQGCRANSVDPGVLRLVGF